jgi:hypothetical protein
MVFLTMKAAELPVDLAHPCNTIHHFKSHFLASLEKYPDEIIRRRRAALLLT